MPTKLTNDQGNWVFLPHFLLILFLLNLLYIHLCSFIPLLNPVHFLIFFIIILLLFYNFFKIIIFLNIIFYWDMTVYHRSPHLPDSVVLT